MMGLTRRQSDCLDFIRAYREVNGIMPSFADIAKGIGLKSRGRISQLLDELIDRGAIRRISHKARAIEIVEPGNLRAVLLNHEIYSLLRSYAASEHISVDAAAGSLLRDALGAAQ